MNSFRLRYSLNKNAGFTLVEMVVVAALIVLLSTSLVTNFSKSKIDVSKNVQLTISTIRSAQVKATSSTQYGGTNRCGYGIRYSSPSQIDVYVGPTASGTNCTTINKNYAAGEDTIISSQKFLNSQIEVKSAFGDIFFMPPDPKTFLNNNSSLNQQPISIIIGVAGQSCGSECKTIRVYPSGAIEVQ